MTVDVVFDGSDASMDVKNASGAELAAPSLYVVMGTGEQRDGVVTDAATIPDGESATFQVTFPDDVDEQTIGLVILSFGDSNYGAFAPVPRSPDAQSRRDWRARPRRPAAARARRSGPRGGSGTGGPRG